ncbi:MAG: phytoene desaturase family protein, partial [Candidatus Dormibacteria bacterium]
MRRARSPEAPKTTRTVSGAFLISSTPPLWGRTAPPRPGQSGARVCEDCGVSAGSKGATRYDTVVIGGGHNGLVCAAYLARAGQRVLVLERRERVGGAAVTEEVWPGYRVSLLSYVVSLLRPAIVEELQLHRFGYRVYPLDPAYFMPFPDGRHLLYWEDLPRAAAEIARFSERDAVALLDYDRTLGELVGLVRPLLDRIPPQLPPQRAGDLREALGLG